MDKDFICWQNFIFDEEGMEIFKKEFYSDSQLSLTTCPICKSNNIHLYKDCFFCFDCKFRKETKDFSQDFVIGIKNGYLMRKNKKTGKIDFWHRFYMSNEIKEFTKSFPECSVHIHHDNENTFDNRKCNLTVMTEGEHKQHHEEVGQQRAYDSYCYKKYGEYFDGDAWEEFIEWQDKKQQEGICY